MQTAAHTYVVGDSLCVRSLLLYLSSHPPAAVTQMMTKSSNGVIGFGKAATTLTSLVDLVKRVQAVGGCSCW